MSESQELIPIKNANPAVLFAPGGLSELLDRVETDARALVPDLTTAKGRSAIASNAARVAKTKVYLDDLGKEFVGELKKQTTAIDAERKAMRDRLDALKDEVRRPLTEWEQAEKDRVNSLQLRLSHIENCFITAGCGSADIAQMIERANSWIFGDDWQEFAAEAEIKRRSLLERLHANLEAQIAREDADRIRAEREAEIAAREAAERAERIEREAKERESRAAKEATERAQRQAEEAMEAERRKQEAMRIDAERRAAVAEQQAKSAAENERKRIENEARIAREKAEILARDEENRARIRSEIYADILDEVILDGIAETVVDAIMNSRIRHIVVEF